MDTKAVFQSLISIEFYNILYPMSSHACLETNSGLSYTSFEIFRGL